MSRPAQEFIGNIIRLGHLVGPTYLGRYLYACCRKNDTNAEAQANPELWRLWEKRCGMTGLAAVEQLGLQARWLQTTIGPLHIMLNSLSDIQKQHEHTFIRPFYRLFTGEPTMCQTCTKTHTHTPPQRKAIAHVCACVWTPCCAAMQGKTCTPTRGSAKHCACVSSC